MSKYNNKLWIFQKIFNHILKLIMNIDLVSKAMTNLAKREMKTYINYKNSLEI